MLTPDRLMTGSVTDFVLAIQLIHNIIYRMSYSQHRTKITIGPNRFAMFLEDEDDMVLISSIAKEKGDVSFYDSELYRSEGLEINLNNLNHAMFDQETMHPPRKATKQIKSNKGLKGVAERLAGIIAFKKEEGIYIPHCAAIQTLSYMENLPDLTVELLKATAFPPVRSKVAANALNEDTSDLSTFVKTTIESDYEAFTLRPTFTYQDFKQQQTVVCDEVALSDLIDKDILDSMSVTEKHNVMESLSCLALQRDMYGNLIKAGFNIGAGIKFNETHAWF